MQPAGPWKAPCKHTPQQGPNAAHPFCLPATLDVGTDTNMKNTSEQILLQNFRDLISYHLPFTPESNVSKRGEAMLGQSLGSSCDRGTVLSLDH